MANYGKRMVRESLISQISQGDGSSYTAGTGIDITEDVISVDNTVALKSELFSGDYDDLTDKPDLSVYETKAEAFSGDYDDLTNKPTIPAAVSGTNDGTNWTSLTVGSDTYGIPAGGSGGGSTYTHHIAYAATDPDNEIVASGLITLVSKTISSPITQLSQFISLLNEGTFSTGTTLAWTSSTGQYKADGNLTGIIPNISSTGFDAMGIELDGTISTVSINTSLGYNVTIIADRVV